MLQDGQEKSITAELVQPKRLVPVHIQNQPPTYFIIAGLVFTQVQAPAITWIMCRRCQWQHVPPRMCSSCLGKARIILCRLWVCIHVS